MSQAGGSVEDRDAISVLETSEWEDLCLLWGTLYLSQSHPGPDGKLPPGLVIAYHG